MPDTEELIRNQIHEMYRIGEQAAWDPGSEALMTKRRLGRIPVPDGKVLALIVAAAAVVVVGLVLTATAVSHRQTSVTSTGGIIGVPASSYRVVVTASGTCFVRATQGTNGATVADDLTNGQTAEFSAKNGKLSVILGSVQVKVDVQVDGKKIWQYTPTKAPLLLHFHSVS